MSDMNTCPLPELIDEFRKSAKTALDGNDMLRGMVYGVIAHRYEELLDVLKQVKREDLYHAWQQANGKTEAEVREMIGVSD
jgi:hypothetical protein